MFKEIARLPRKYKIASMLLCDIVLLPLALWSAIALRLGTFSPSVGTIWWIFVLVPFVTVPIFVKIGLYRAVVRYMDDRIIVTVFYGVSLSVLALSFFIFLGRASSLPRSSLLIYWIMGIAYISLSRFMARGVLRGLEQRGDRREKVAIYGAGRSGLQTALALRSGPEFRPVAFFDDNPELHGSNVAGIRVYDPAQALEVLDENDCHQLLIAMPSASRARRREVIRNFDGKGIKLKTLPGMGEILDGKVRIEDIREVGVEDLLGRDPVPPQAELMDKCIKGQAVLVTGAGGSIGTELCRQIAHKTPSTLVLYELNEFSLYKIDQELRKHFPFLNLVPVLGDVLDSNLFKQILQKYQIQTVYHAAAYKHVPIVEANIISGVRNNALGTWRAAVSAKESGVKNFVLISTDKAVRPTNVMGASKRLAELVLQALAVDVRDIRFTMVRFGNVLGSSGSVVPLFKEQIRVGGPITVTHPEVTRYFMTIPEAAQLVLQAGSMGKGGDVFVLDMGEPVKIFDLAVKMIEMSGLEVRNGESGVGDIAVEFVGLRPGEKLYEELLIGENVEPTTHPRIMSAREHMLSGSVLFPKLEVMSEACENGEISKVMQLLRDLVQEYRVPAAPFDDLSS